MLQYDVRKGKSGWFIDNSAVCYGPYHREDKAVAAAESLNRQARERTYPIALERQDVGSRRSMPL